MSVNLWTIAVIVFSLGINVKGKLNLLRATVNPMIAICEEHIFLVKLNSDSSMYSSQTL